MELGYTHGSGARKHLHSRRQKWIRGVSSSSHHPASSTNVSIKRGTHGTDHTAKVLPKGKRGTRGEGTERVRVGKAEKSLHVKRETCIGTKVRVNNCHHGDTPVTTRKRWRDSKEAKPYRGKKEKKWSREYPNTRKEHVRKTRSKGRKRKDKKTNRKKRRS